MSPSRALSLWLTCLSALTSGCSGCATREEKAPSEAAPTEPQPVETVKQLPDGWSRVFGEEDVASRYSSTVSLVATAPAQHPRFRECSGVLLTPNLVLTAGHCVCEPETNKTAGSGATRLIDASRCAKTATAFLTYSTESTKDKGLMERRFAEHPGDVKPHPQIQIRLDAQGAIISSRADLAVIRLHQPADKAIRPVRLATAEVKSGEVLTVVGYGYVTDTGGMDGRRRYIHEKALEAADAERTLLGGLERADYKGDTGGPCLRETEQEFELVGISQRGLGKAPALTRITAHREWLEEQMRLSAQ